MGHQWVKDRFRIRETTDVDGNKRFTGTHPERPYIPAFVSDNVYIDQASYLDGLNNLDPITRARLKAGDWSVSVDSRFKRSWARYYSTRSNRFILGREGRGEVIEGFSQLFAVVDPAGSSKEGPGDTDRYRKQKSWTVVGVFGLTYDYQLLLLDVRRERVEIPDIIPILKSVYRQWAPQKYLIEGTGLGRGVFQMALRAGLPCVPVFPHADKVVRSTAAQVRMEQGRIWFPEPPGPSWLETWEGEVFTWTGHPHETDDQVDVLAHAANHIAWEAANMDASLIQPNGEGEPNIIDVPFVIDNRQFFNGGVAHLPVQF
jgi:predicted phage terminase large subunit-like protein